MNLCEAWREYRRDPKAKGVRYPCDEDWVLAVSPHGSGGVVVATDGGRSRVNLADDDLERDDWEVVRGEP